MKLAGKETFVGVVGLAMMVGLFAACTVKPDAVSWDRINKAREKIEAAAQQAESAATTAEAAANKAGMAAQSATESAQRADAAAQRVESLYAQSMAK